MRNVFTLNRESVQDIADRTETEVRNRRARGWTLVLLPVLGLAPAVLQKKWAKEWGFAAGRATMMSAALELLAGTVGTVQLVAAAVGAVFFIPLALALPGPLLFVFGIARLAMVFGDGEPVGSPLGVPFLLLAPKSVPEAERESPAVQSFDNAGGFIVVVSPVLRRDWDRDGLLPYRGAHFRLDGVEQEGRSWVYRFTRDHDRSTEERTLQLRPPLAAALAAAPKVAPPSFLRTMMVTAAVTLGPGSDQQRWAEELGTRAVWFTVIGGTAELVGGIANLQKELDAAQSWLILLNMFLVGEGLLRLGSALVGRPMGSVFGWALRPLYHRSLPSKPS
jgi:hypothetical protein